MKTENLQKNRGEATQKFLGFFGTAPSLVVFTLFSLLYTFNFPISANALITSGVASKAGNLSRGLIGYWTFDGKNMTSATSTDTSGSGNDGAFHGSPTVSLGAVGQAITLNGSNQYISAVGNNNTTFAVSAWFKLNQTSNFGPILEYGDSLSKRYGAFIQGGYLGIIFNNGGTNYVLNQTSGVRMDDGKWHHVVAMTAGGANTTMYIDGVQATLGNQYIAGAGVANVLEIGTFAYAPIGTTYLFAGQLDDIRLYNRTLSTAEALALYKMANNATRAAPTGPIAHWKFDNNTLTSATATDSSGQGNDGTLSGISFPTNIATGKVGQAVHFDGSTSFVTGPDINALDGASAMTTCAWIKEDSLVADKAIVAKWTYQTQGNFGLQTGSGAAGKLSMFLATSLNDNGNGSLTSTTNTVLVAGQWQHVCAVFDGTLTGDTNRLKIYVNGTSVALTQGAGAVPSSLTAGGTAPVLIGKFGGSLDRYFNGSIDDVKIYTRALSSSEITSIYKSTQTASTYAVTAPATNPLSRGLVSNITFDGKYTNTSTSTDLSGTGNDGGLSATPVFALGKVGQALSFNASNYVNLGNASNLQLSNGTISAWVKGSGCTGASGYCGIITKGNAYSLYTLNNVFGSYDWGGGAFRTSSVNIADGKWHHVAETFQSGVSNGSVLYLDGAPVLTTTMTVNSQLYAAEIGRGGTNGGTNQLWNGLVDDARIYNRPLTAKEILTLYKMGSK